MEAAAMPLFFTKFFLFMININFKISEDDE